MGFSPHIILAGCMEQEPCCPIFRHRAIGFSRDWKGSTSKKSERQTFWNEFFNVFGIKRRTVPSFKDPVKKLSGNWSYIDLFWPARVIVEHKSAGQRQMNKIPGRTLRQFLEKRPQPKQIS